MPKLWPTTCKRATVASSMINTWEKAFGTEFRGATYLEDGFWIDYIQVT